ncbi:MAG: hypothetical protein ABSG77_10185 [Candidatus Acidiferrum sp.]|jgi:hypothetical protein
MTTASFFGCAISSDLTRKEELGNKDFVKQGGRLKMADYIKTELDQNGIAVLRGSFGKVNDRDAASRFSYSDAQFFQRQAFEQWPDFIWKTEDVGEHKYLVKADAMKAKRKRGLK